MSLGKRIFLWAAGGLAGLVLLVGITAVFVLQSSWFFDKVRHLIIGTVETATGGRVEGASFRFDWRHLRAGGRGFVLHGTEPADKPPPFRAESLGGDLKPVSLLRKDVGLQALAAREPHS